MGIYIIQILPAAKIKKKNIYEYYLAELSQAEIIPMRAAPGMLINAEVTKMFAQRKQGKHLSQRRCVWFNYQDTQPRKR